MVHVCKEWFPSSNPAREDGFDMNPMLKQQIDILLKNIKNDWNFTILIAGQGEMRVGKSLLAMQIGMYWSYMIKRLYNLDVPFTIKENMVLNGNELLIKGKNLGAKYKYAVLDYDEAADDLEGTKVMSFATKQMKDWLRKSAQYNMLTILIQSEFFEVPKAIAISRSSCLIDVSYNADESGIFRRGYFSFFSRRKKKLLYLLGKKMLDYHKVQPDFRGTFPHFYPVNEEEYRKEKFDCLKKWERVSGMDYRRQEWLRAAFKFIYAQGLTHREIANKLNELCKIKISYKTVGRLLQGEEIGEDDADEAE